MMHTGRLSLDQHCWLKSIFNRSSAQVPKKTLTYSQRPGTNERCHSSSKTSCKEIRHSNKNIMWTENIPDKSDKSNVMMHWMMLVSAIATPWLWGALQAAPAVVSNCTSLHAWQFDRSTTMRACHSDCHWKTDQNPKHCQRSKRTLL